MSRTRFSFINCTLISVTGNSHIIHASMDYLNMTLQLECTTDNTFKARNKQLKIPHAYYKMSVHL